MELGNGFGYVKEAETTNEKNAPLLFFHVSALEGDFRELTLGETVYFEENPLTPTQIQKLKKGKKKKFKE